MHKEIAPLIEHTNLKPNAKSLDIKKLCKEAKEHGFASVCVNPVWITLAKEELKGSCVKICTVIGFPLGATLPEQKKYEAILCTKQGADEFDMVINIGALKEKNHELVLEDIKGVTSAGKTTKVIIETCYLTKEEKINACLLAKEAGAQFVKTSTGFSQEGAKAEDVRLMKQTVGKEIGVKASGGINTYVQAKKMIDAGATRIGTSKGVEIVSQNEP